MSKEEQTNLRMGKELWEQSCMGDIQKILHLLKNGAPINWRDSSDEWTALHRACFYNCPAIVEVLLKYKPNINHMTHVGDTALHLSCRYGHMECVKLLLSTNECNLEIINTLGRSPVGDAVYTKKLDVIKFFIVEYHVDINGPITNFGETILQLPVRLEMLDVIEFLITAVDVKGLKESLFEVVIREGTINTIKWVLSELNVLEVNLQNPITKSGDTLLGLAIREGRIEVVEYAFMFTSLQQKLISASMYVTKSGDTLLGLAIRTGQLDIIKFLVTKLEMDEKSCITESGDTPLVLAVREGKLNVIKYLVTERFFAADDAHLFLACEYGHTQIVDYLLTDHQLNPNALNVQQISPLSLTKKKEIIKLLLQHGADAKDVYTDHRKSLGKIFTKDPLKSPVKMFVIGDGGEGKSTLIEALEHEPTFKTSFASIFVSPKEVDGVSQNTAGIIPRVFKSRLYGDVQFYDFAGQETYYSSHAAIIKSVIDTCPPIFVLVLGLHRTDEAITHSICYWLGIIANQCANLEEKAPLIIVGSHADLIPKTEAKRIKIIVMKTVQNFALFNLVDIIPLDCRYSNSDELKLLRHCVGNICTFIRSKLSVSLNSHMFLIYLLDKHSNKLAVSLEEVQAQIETNVKQDLDLSATHILAFIPTSITRLVDICHQLCDKGHILFQFNKSFPEKSVIIIDKAALLSEVNGTMFAPENFRQHCQLSTSTGVVPRSKLAEHFPKFDIEMLSDFLFHFELAVPIEDEEVLSLINQRLTKASEAATVTSPEKSYIFCPALIQIEVPHKVFVHQETLLYHFGWVLFCIHKEHFFDARFLHVLILRLALSLGLAPVVDPSIPALQRQCFVWKTGVCWKTPQGAAVLVEVVDKKKVMVLLQSNNVSFDLLKLRTTLIRKVVETSHEFCSSIVTEELLLSPTDVTYPLKFSSTLPLYSQKSLAQSIVQQEPFVVSIKGTEQLPVSVLEVYANLGENILQPLFNQNDPIHNKKISDRALLHLCRCWSKNSQLLNIICSAISSTTCVSSEANIEVALRAWRDGCDGTYRALRLFVDSFSVFAGKNLIDLAGVPYKKFVEDLLPLSNPIVSPLTSTGGGLGGLTIEDLKKKTGITDSQLDTKLIDLEQELHKLAGCFDNVETYLGKLGLTAGQQNDVKQIAYRQNTNIAMAEALRLWLQPNPFVASIRALLEILLDLDKGDVALQVCHAVHQLTKSSGVLQ